jgi:hypothetical protein
MNYWCQALFFLNKWVTLLPFLIAHFCHVEARESIFFFFKSSRLDDLGKEKSDTKSDERYEYNGPFCPAPFLFLSTIDSENFCFLFFDR